MTFVCIGVPCFQCMHLSNHFYHRTNSVCTNVHHSGLSGWSNPEARAGSSSRANPHSSAHLSRPDYCFPSTRRRVHHLVNPPTPTPIPSSSSIPVGAHFVEATYWKIGKPALQFPLISFASSQGCFLHYNTTSSSRSGNEIPLLIMFSTQTATPRLIVTHCSRYALNLVIH